MKPFLAGRPALEGAALRPTGGPLASSHSTSGGPASDHGHGHGHGPGQTQTNVPAVQCIKQGDKVVRLVVTCTCGERIEVECLYPAGG